jgi:coenzyme F420 hydrogenase subunit beta
MDVLEKVVAKGWCIGCGMCAGVCPKERLAMKWNERGEYNPVEVENCGDCPESCSLCYQVCPAHGETKNESVIGREWYGHIQGIHHTDETGYYLAAYAGYSKRHRAAGASGGMATWMLESLLFSRHVDAVAAVGRTADPDKLFEFKICRNVDELRACSRSAYYPVEVSHVIRHIFENDGRYAIIGLPCVCKAIRLAQDKIPKLKRRIKYVLGLTCGHQCSRYFAEYICSMGGGDPSGLREIVFRTKDLSQPASNHGIRFRSGAGRNEVSKQVFWRDGAGFAYSTGYFQLPGCFYCDDVFAECADAVFMDAWLREYIKDPGGTNLFLVRNIQMNKMVKSEIGKVRIAVRNLPINKIICSQRDALDQKRKQISTKDTTPKIQGYSLKRIFPLILNMTEVRKSISIVSGEKWVNNKNYESFTRVIRPLKRKMLRYQTRKRLVLLPSRTLNKLIGFVKQWFV